MMNASTIMSILGIILLILIVLILISCIRSYIRHRHLWSSVSAHISDLGRWNSF